MKYLFSITIVAALLSLSSCYTDPAYGVGVVTVMDENDFRVPTANVKLYQPGQTGEGFILVEGYTDNNGEFSYEHIDPSTDLALEVILQINATKDGKIGQGIIRIKPDEVSHETVRLYL